MKTRHQKIKVLFAASLLSLSACNSSSTEPEPEVPVSTKLELEKAGLKLLCENTVGESKPGEFEGQPNFSEAIVECKLFNTSNEAMTWSLGFTGEPDKEKFEINYCAGWLCFDRPTSDVPDTLAAGDSVSEIKVTLTPKPDINEIGAEFTVGFGVWPTNTPAEVLGGDFKFKIVSE